MMKPIHVGLIGIAPGRSWGAIAHVPALAALPEYKAAAVCTTRLDSARAAATAFDIPLAFDNPRDLVASPEVELVAVLVKVPHHFELVSAALGAGKPVFCEWPLGNGLDEAVKMADLARRTGVRTIVGLQARSAPAVNYVHDLVRDGYVGEVLSTTMIGSGSNWGPVIDAPNAYTADKANGATVLTIPFGHTVDALCYCLGEFRELSATTALCRRSFTVRETGQVLPMTAEDQVAVSGILENGAAASIHYRGGMTRGTNFLWEINGTEGDLQLTAYSGHLQIVEPVLRGGRADQKELAILPVPDRYRWVPGDPSGPAFNVAQAYARFAEDLRNGTRSVPDFDDAVRRHRMIAAIEAAAASGTRVRLTPSRIS